MHVFKYFDEKHKEAFRSYGQVKLGTIEHYRQIEDERRKDHEEGRFTFLFLPTDEAIHLTSNQANAITYDYQIKDGTGLSIMPGGAFSSDLTAPNVYVYCASNSYSKTLRHKFGGCCFRIKNVKIFGQLLFEELHKQQEMLFWISRRVTYVKTKMIHVTNENKEKVIPERKFKKHPLGKVREIELDDYFSKTAFRFQIEDEYRFVFVPKETPIHIEPIVSNSAIAKSCVLF